MRHLYECEKCGEVYESQAEAEKCEAQREDVLLKVGDIVKYGAFGWYDGDRRWIANPEVVAHWDTDDVCTHAKVNGRPCPSGNDNCMDSCCYMEFYYVVTAIDERCERGIHRTQYHLFTKAMMTGYRSGYTYNSDHVTVEALKNPPQLDDVEDLIGQRATGLL